MFLLSTSWDKVTPGAIQNCWHQIFSYSDNDASEFDWNSEYLVPLSPLNRRRESVNDEHDINYAAKRYHRE